MMSPKNIRLALVAPICWGVSFALAKPASAHFSPLFMILIVYATIGAITLVTVREAFKTPWWKLFVIAACSVTIQGGILFSAMRYVDSSTANLVLQTQVPAAIFLGWLLADEELNAAKLVGTFVALLGVAVVIGLPEQRPPLLPVLAIMVSGFVWALGQVLARIWSKDSGMLVLKANALFAVPQLIVATLLLEDGQLAALQSAGAREWIYLGFVGLVGFYFAYVAWFTLLKRVRVDEAAPFVLLMTPIGVATAVLLLGEQLTWPLVVGGILILGGLSVVTGVVKLGRVAGTHP
jgi:O-acetylserine/cysteine efflux transporter